MKTQEEILAKQIMTLSIAFIVSVFALMISLLILSLRHMI